MGIQSTITLTRQEAEDRAIDRLDQDSGETYQALLDIVEQRLRGRNNEAKRLLVKCLTNDELERVLDETFYNYMIGNAVDIL